MSAPGLSRRTLLAGAAASRRIVVDVRSGAIVLDREFDHAPAIVVTAP